jgi:hypothetical protein
VRSAERATERASDRAIALAIDRAIDRAIGRATERTQTTAAAGRPRARFQQVTARYLAVTSGVTVRYLAVTPDMTTSMRPGAAGQIADGAELSRGFGAGAKVTARYLAVTSQSSVGQRETLAESASCPAAVGKIETVLPEAAAGRLNKRGGKTRGGREEV